MLLDQFPARFGKYILLDRINAGGMAEVFCAKATGVENFERLVAIKCMLPSLLNDERFRNMFIDEAKLAAQLSHANIVQIYELGELEHYLYIVMELVNGKDLRNIIRTAKRLKLPIPISFASYAISKAAEGLDFAHRQLGKDGQPLHLVHRDVSPQNILVSYDGEIKVVDFGIAKAKSRSTETESGVIKGKFAYMAPEHVNGEAIDHRVDIFALGSVLFEILTGERLFDDDNELALLETVRAGKLPNFSETIPHANKECIAILKKALAKKPRNRYQTAAEMAAAFEPLLIEERSIFGSKRAAEFMTLLYAQEKEALSKKLIEYSTINDVHWLDHIDNQPLIFGNTEDAKKTSPQYAPPIAVPSARLQHVPRYKKTIKKDKIIVGESQDLIVKTTFGTKAVRRVSLFFLCIVLALLCVSSAVLLEKPAIATQVLKDIYGLNHIGLQISRMFLSLRESFPIIFNNTDSVDTNNANNLLDAKR